MVSHGFKVVQDFIHPQYDGVSESNKRGFFFCISQPAHALRTLSLAFSIGLKFYKLLAGGWKPGSRPSRFPAPGVFT